MVARLGPWGQVAEVDVLPEHGRRGVGRRLVERALRWGDERGLPGMVLSTMIAPPWNAPFYERLGFRSVPPNELDPYMRRLREEEARLGFPVAERVVMKRLTRTS